MVKKVSVFVLALVGSFASMAQCAMCRTQVQNNVSNGDVDLAAGLNTGILYLMVTPYLALSVVGLLWYRNSKKKGGKESLLDRIKKRRKKRRDR